MKPSEAAKVIGCGRNHVHYLIREGKLKAKKTRVPGVGVFYDIPHAEVIKYKLKPQVRGFPRGRKREGERGTATDVA